MVGPAVKAASCPDFPTELPDLDFAADVCPSTPDVADVAGRFSQADPACETTPSLSPIVREGEEQLRVWRRDPEWAEEPPFVKASSADGAFLRLETSTLVGLPPALVFGLLCDVGNKRVFKNVKGVRHRTVLEETTQRAVVELEMITGWRFLVFSGDFGVFMHLEQDRVALKISFNLVKPGFMRQFGGEWSVEPVEVPGDGTKEPRVASRVRLVQEAQPSLNPPPIIAQFLRQIAAKTLKDSMEDMQLEAARIRFGLPEDVDVRAELKNMKTSCLVPIVSPAAKPIDVRA